MRTAQFFTGYLVVGERYKIKKFLIHIIFFFQVEDGIRDYKVTGVQTCALPICVDNFMRSELCFENSGDAAPDCAGRNRRDAAQRQKHDCRQVKKGRDRGIAWVLNAELESDQIGRASCRERR